MWVPSNHQPGFLLPALLLTSHVNLSKLLCVSVPSFPLSLFFFFHFLLGMKYYRYLQFFNSLYIFRWTLQPKTSSWRYPQNSLFLFIAKLYLRFWIPLYFETYFFQQQILRILIIFSDTNIQCFLLEATSPYLKGQSSFLGSQGPFSEESKTLTFFSMLLIWLSYSVLVLSLLFSCVQSFLYPLYSIHLD